MTAILYRTLSKAKFWDSLPAFRWVNWSDRGYGIDHSSNPDRNPDELSGYATTQSTMRFCNSDAVYIERFAEVNIFDARFSRSFAWVGWCVSRYSVARLLRLMATVG